MGSHVPNHPADLKTRHVQASQMRLAILNPRLKTSACLWKPRIVERCNVKKFKGGPHPIGQTDFPAVNDLLILDSYGKSRIKFAERRMRSW